MSNLTITLSDTASSTASPTWRYYKSGGTYYREGVRDGYFVKDKYKTGGNLTLFLSGGGVKDTDYELISQES